MVDDLALFPLAQDPAGIFARHIGQAARSSWRILVADESCPGVVAGLSQVFGKLKQGACDAGLERQKARSRHLVIRLPQALDQDGEEVPVNLGMSRKISRNTLRARKVNLLSLSA